VVRAEKATQQPPRLGKQRYEPTAAPVMTSDEITGSLREVKPCFTVRFTVAGGPGGGAGSLQWAAAGGGGGKGAACSSARLPLPRLPPSLAPCLPFPHPAAPATCQAQCRLALRVPTHPVLPPFGQVAKDRFKSLQKRGLIEPRRPAHHRKGRRVQYVGGERTEKALEGQVRALKGAEGGGAGRGGGGQINACMQPGHCLALSAGAADASGSPVLS